MTLCFFCSVDESECEGPLDNVYIPCFRGDGVKVRPPLPKWHGDGGGDPNREKLFVFNYVCTALIKRIINFDLKGQGAIPSGSVLTVLINLRACDSCCKAFKEIEEHFQKISSILKDLKASKESIIKARSSKAAPSKTSGNVNFGDTSHSGLMGMEVTPEPGGDEEEMKIVPNVLPEDECGDRDPLSLDTQQSPAASIKEEPLDDEDMMEEFIFPGCDDVADDTGKDSFQKSRQASYLAMKATNNPQATQKKRLCCRFCPYTYTRRSLSIRSHEKQKHGDYLIHKCDSCEEHFSSKQIAEEHSRLDRCPIYPVNCGICGETRINPLEHKVHILSNHVALEVVDDSVAKSRRNYLCKECDVYFNSNSERNRHINEHHKKEQKERLHCDIPGCGKDFSNRQSLITHLLHPSHPLGKDGVVAPVQTCKICGKCFTSQSLLKRHEGLHKLYDGSGRTLICPHCDLPFFPEDEDKLKRHISSMHPPEGLFPCTVPGCRVSFKTHSTLKYHETTKHPELLVHKCSQKGCGAAYSELCYLETHLRIHQTPSESYFCTVPPCSYNKEEYFRTADALQDHLAAHNGECPCPECGETFSDNSKVRCHRIEVHGIEGLGSFPCTFCSLKFGTKLRLDIHQGSNHADEVQTTFSCPVCQKSFYPETLLKIHMRIHRPKKEKVEFACEYCGKVVGDIRQHIDRKHRGDEVNKKVCYFCGKRVYSSSEMLEHLRTHTMERPCICPNYKRCRKDYTQSHCLKTHLKR